MTEHVICADAYEGLKTIEAATIDTCVTSPPYYGLREYGVVGQVGAERTPEEYIKRLVNIFRQVYRVLRDDGTLWVIIGDSYATCSGGQPPTNTGNTQGHTKKRAPPGYKMKDLIGIPWMLAFALRADGWYLRQDIIWNKPNCMPESVTDRCTKSHEYIFLLSKSPRYYYNAVAVREPVVSSTVKRLSRDIYGQAGSNRAVNKTNGIMKAVGIVESGKNKRDVWTVPTAAYKGAHFATFPPNLINPCILAGSRPDGIVLDPFFGVGTTGVVAKSIGRGYIGIEINPQYVDMAKQRLGLE